MFILMKCVNICVCHAHENSIQFIANAKIYHAIVFVEVNFSLSAKHMHGDGSILIGICQSNWWTAVTKRRPKELNEKLWLKRTMEESKEKVLKTMVVSGGLHTMGIIRHWNDVACPVFDEARRTQWTTNNDSVIPPKFGGIEFVAVKFLAAKTWAPATYMRPKKTVGKSKQKRQKTNRMF